MSIGYALQVLYLQNRYAAPQVISYGRAGQIVPIVAGMVSQVKWIWGWVNPIVLKTILHARTIRQRPYFMDIVGERRPDGDQQASEADEYPKRCLISASSRAGQGGDDRDKRGHYCHAKAMRGFLICTPAAAMTYKMSGTVTVFDM